MEKNREIAKVDLKFKALAEKYFEELNKWDGMGNVPKHCLKLSLRMIDLYTPFRCWGCGAEFNASDDYCAKCGKKTYKPVTYRCTKCKSHLERRGKYCTKCGKKNNHLTSPIAWFGRETYR